MTDTSGPGALLPLFRYAGDLLDIDEYGWASPNGTTARRHQPAWAGATSKCETVVSRSTRYSSSSG